MALTHRLGRRYLTNAGTVSDVTQTFTGGAEFSLDASVTTATEPTYLCSIDVSEIVSLMLHSDEDVQLKFNDDGSPTDTIDLTADVMVVWNTDESASCPITADVTTLDIANASGATATVKIRILHQGTL
jgi:hypothetical protein